MTNSLVRMQEAGPHLEYGALLNQPFQRGNTLVFNKTAKLFSIVKAEEAEGLPSDCLTETEEVGEELNERLTNKTWEPLYPNKMYILAQNLRMLSRAGYHVSTQPQVLFARTFEMLTQYGRCADMAEILSLPQEFSMKPLMKTMAVAVANASAACINEGQKYLEAERKEHVGFRDHCCQVMQATSELFVGKKEVHLFVSKIQPPVRAAIIKDQTKSPVLRAPTCLLPKIDETVLLCGFATIKTFLAKTAQIDGNEAITVSRWFTFFQNNFLLPDVIAMMQAFSKCPDFYLFEGRAIVPVSEFLPLSLAKLVNEYLPEEFSDFVEALFDISRDGLENEETFEAYCNIIGSFLRQGSAKANFKLLSMQDNFAMNSGNEDRSADRLIVEIWASHQRTPRRALKPYELIMVKPAYTFAVQTAAFDEANPKDLPRNLEAVRELISGVQAHLSKQQ